MQLSENFWLEEFLRSQTATRHGIDLESYLTDEILANLKRLCQDILQPIRYAAEVPLIVTSGFRPEVLNELIGGSKTSAHMEGRAADFRLHGYTPFQACNLILGLPLEFDQLILEFNQWVHIGIARTGFDPRLQLLTAKKEEGKTMYHLGILV